ASVPVRPAKTHSDPPPKISNKRQPMRKILASLALGFAALGFVGLSGSAMAQDAASAPASAAAATASAAAAAPAASAAADAASAPAAAASTPVANKGDVSWMIVATLLV